MRRPPREPEAFTEHLARLLAERLGPHLPGAGGGPGGGPGARIDITGPFELTIDDRRVGLEDLYRAMHHAEQDPAEALDQFVEVYLNTRQLEETPLPFEVVKPRILPRIQPLGFFRDRRPDFFAAQPFVNDTVILYMIDLNGTVTPLTTEQLIRWGIDVETADELARENLARQRGEVELRVFRGEDGAAALFNTGDGYDASRLLLGELYAQLSPEMGGDFLVAIPNRDVFIAFPPEPDRFVGRVHRRIRADYRKLPYPITDNLFLVTLDGVADWRPAA